MTNKSDHPTTRRRRILSGSLAAGLAAAALAVIPAAPSLAAECGPATIWTSSPLDGSTVFLEYSPTGEVLTTLTAPGVAAIQDIAVSADGTRLWGIGIDTGLYEFDMATGAVISHEPVTGPWIHTGNALSVLPNGNLVTAAATAALTYQQLYEINPTTHTSTEIVGATLPIGYSTAGDFLTIGPDTLLITVTTPEAYDALWVMDLSTTPATGAVHGYTPSGLGAAQSNGSVYIASWDGILYRLDGVPAEPTEEELGFTEVADVRDSGTADLDSFFGAASSEDAGPCVETPDSAATPQLANTGGLVDYAPIGLALIALAGGAVLVGARRASRA